MISKKMLIAVGAVTVAAGAYGITQVSAASDPANPQTSLVQKIADTFHLDKSKVQAVFDQNRSDKQAQAETNYENRLDQAVTAGKITSDQKSLILTEHNHLKSELTAAMAKTGADRRTALEQVRTEAQNWAKQNNIDAKWLLGQRPFRGMGPMMRHRHTNGAATPTPSPTPSSSPSA